MTTNPAKRPVGAWQIVRDTPYRDQVGPKIHLRRTCEGLEHVRLASLRRLRFASLADLGESTDARPCRMCGLEKVLLSVLRPTAHEASVFVTFTSQGNPAENLRSFAWKASTESGSARLARLAERLGLPTGEASCGRFAYGFLPVSGAEILSRNLRTVIRPDYTGPGLPDLTVMECAWALLAENPPELEIRWNATDTPPDAWELAQLLVA